MAINNIWEYDASTAANNTAMGAVSIAEGMARSDVNNAMREFAMQARRLCAQGSDIASAATCNIAATGTSFYAKVTGTTGISSFGTANAGVWRWITFTGALTITYNATSMILDGAANFTTSAGDMIFAVSEGSGNWRVRIFRADGKPVVSGTIGKHMVFIPAAAMTLYPGSTAAFATTLITNHPVNSWDFDQTTNEFVFWQMAMPSSWDEGTVTAVFLWTAASGSGDVVWRLYGAAYSNDDALGDTLSNTASATDTLLTANDLHRSPESSALTIQNTPAANDMVTFFAARFSSSGSDTLNADARLIGVELYITTSAATDTAS